MDDSSPPKEGLPLQQDERPHRLTKQEPFRPGFGGSKVPGNSFRRKITATISGHIPTPFATGEEPTILPPFIGGGKTPNKTFLIWIAGNLNLPGVSHTLRNPVLYSCRKKEISAIAARLPQSIEMTNFAGCRGSITFRLPHQTQAHQNHVAIGSKLSGRNLGFRKEPGDERLKRKSYPTTKHGPINGDRTFRGGSTLHNHQARSRPLYPECQNDFYTCKALLRRQH